MPDAIEVTGLAELIRATALAGAELRKELRAALVEGGELVAEKARQIAAGEGLDASGSLIRKIGVSAKMASSVVLVKDTASRVSKKFPAGYAYPGRYEFGDRDRPFLVPALDAEREAVAALVEARIVGLLARTL